MVRSRSVYNETSGVSYDEHYNKGMVRNTLASADEQRGVPVPESHAMHSNDVKRYCEGVTVKGTACQARPVSDTSLCAGHSKAVRSRESDSVN